MLNCDLADALSDLGRLDPTRPALPWIQDAADRARGCDGCGETRADVDLWVENDETGEQIWLCPMCDEA